MSKSSDKPDLIPLAIIVRDPAIQQRDGPADPEYARQLCDAIRNGDELPPSDVFREGSGEKYWLADGFNRFNGYELHGAKRMPCHVHKGDRRDAILFACGANARNGKHRTKADRDKAIATLLDDKEWSNASNVWLAEIVHCDETTIRRFKKDREIRHTTSRIGNAEPETKGVKGRDGKTYPSRKSTAPRALSNKSSGLEDDNKFPIPERLVEAFTSEFYREVPSGLGAWIKQAQSIAGWNRYLDVQAIEHLKAAKRLIEASAPGLVCRECEGKGCSVCKRTGFVLKVA